MVQHHLLQVLAFVAMEPPDSLAPEDVRDRKADLLEARRPFSADEVVRGQYVAGVVEGYEVPGYRDEERVSPQSTVETFVALRAWIDNPRWNGVPCFVRTGKRLPHRATEVAIILRACASQTASCSRVRASRACRYTIWRCASSPTRASCWPSGPRNPRALRKSAHARCGGTRMARATDHDKLNR
jgi:glucose-6-phosphate 1-dehydrogenase